MENQAFLLGRFLKLADQLHKEYCIAVRNGGDKTQPLPNQAHGKCSVYDCFAKSGGST